MAVRGLAASIGLMACSVLQAQHLSVDRPDYTESPNLTGRQRLQLEQGIYVAENRIDPSINFRQRLGSSTELRCLASGADGLEWGGKWVSNGDRSNRLGVIGSFNVRKQAFRFIAVGEHDLKKFTFSWNAGGVHQDRTLAPWLTLGAACKLGSSIQILGEWVYLPGVWHDAPQFNFGALYFVGPWALDVLIEPSSLHRGWGVHLGATTSVSWERLKQTIPRRPWSRRIPQEAIAAGGEFGGGSPAILR